MKKVEVKKAIDILKQGGVIIYPTDTAYALGGVFNNKKVINKILKIKKRTDKKFTLIASSLSQVKKFFQLSEKEIKLAKTYWPGPLSIVVSNNYAIRVPASAIARKLARGVGSPIIATSANIAGGRTPCSVQDVLGESNSGFSNPSLIKKKPGGVNLVINVGILKNKKTSTIVKVEKEAIKIIRKGALKL